jgi:hypothetical protein
MAEILTLWSPHKLLKNLGALSEYAKSSQSSIKKLKSLLSILDTMEWSKKPYHATVPLSFSVEVPTWTVLVMSLFYGLISLLAFLGNSLVIYVVATSRRMQVSPHQTR